MNQKTQLTILGILIAAFIGVAAYQFLKPKRAVAKAAEVEADDAPVLSGLPSRSELLELAEWVAPETAPMASGAFPANGVLGVGGIEEEQAAEEDVTATAPVVPAAQPFVPPPRLQGVFINGRLRVAMFGGEAYRPGQQVRNTDFRVVEIARSSVKLRAEGGEDLTLDLPR